MQRLDEREKLDRLAIQCAGNLANDLYEGLPAFLDALNSASVSLGAGEFSLQQLRATAAAVREPWNKGGPAMLEIRDLELAAVEGVMRARLYRPTAEWPAPTLVYMHGGGWALLGIDTHDRLMREYAAASGWAVIGLDYPRAPETGYPHISEACLAAIHDLRERSASLGLAADRMVLGGDSSGANLAARRKAATCSDPKRPLWPLVDWGGVIVAVGCSFDVIFVLYGQSRWLLCFRRWPFALRVRRGRSDERCGRYGRGWRRRRGSPMTSCHFARGSWLVIRMAELL